MFAMVWLTRRSPTKNKVDGNSNRRHWSKNLNQQVLKSEMGYQFWGSQMFLISLRETRGTYINNYKIFSELTEIKFY